VRVIGAFAGTPALLKRGSSAGEVWMVQGQTRLQTAIRNKDHKGVREMLLRDQQKLQRITKKVINESTPEQLAQMYEGLEKAISLRSARGICTDECLTEIAATLVPEMNARRGGGGGADPLRGARWEPERKVNRGRRTKVRLRVIENTALASY